MNKLKKIVSIIIILILAFLYAHIAKANNIYDKKVDNSEYLSTGVVCEGVIEQKLIGDVQDVKIKYGLIDNQSGKCIAEGVIEAKDIKPSKFYTFSFDTLSGTRKKEYTFFFENLNAEENRGIGIFFQPTAQKGTELIISGNRTEGTLILKTITDRFDVETFAILLIFVVYIVVFMRFLYKLFK